MEYRHRPAQGGNRRRSGRSGGPPTAGRRSWPTRRAGPGPGRRPARHKRNDEGDGQTGGGRGQARHEEDLREKVRDMKLLPIKNI